MFSHGCKHAVFRVIADIGSYAFDDEYHVVEVWLKQSG